MDGLKFLLGFAGLWLVVSAMEDSNSMQQFAGALAGVIAVSTTLVYYQPLTTNIQGMVK